MVGEFLTREVEIRGKSAIFQVYVPAIEVSDQAPLPAILFLHGYGESGEDGARQSTIGLGDAIRENPGDWPFLVVFPQKPDFQLWPVHVELLNKILEAVDAEFPTDSARRFLTGLSQGGNGTLMLVDRLHWKFAGAVAICGWADPITAVEPFVRLPLWLIHGTDDTAVPIAGSESVAEFLGAKGVPPKLTIYPGVGHDSWTKGYREPIGRWLLK